MLLNKIKSKNLVLTTLIVLIIDVFIFKKDLPEFSIDANEQRKCYIKDNFDVIINIKLENYTVGSQYADGYTYTFPVTTQNSIYTTNGPVTVTTTSQQTNY